MGAASRWWLAHSLKALAADLSRLQIPLILRQGAAGEELKKLVRESGAEALYWNQRWEPAAVVQEQKVRAAVSAGGVQVFTFNGSLLLNPEAVKNRSGGPYKVFTPFWRVCSANLGEQKTLPKMKEPVAALKKKPLSTVRFSDLEPAGDWSKKFTAYWRPGESGATVRFRAFAEAALENYEQGRDRPDWSGTSKLSPHLHFGEISLRRIWKEVVERLDGAPRPNDCRARSAEAFLRQIFWREFAFHLLRHFPETPTQPLRETFARLPWQKNPAGFRAWQKGKTGCPLVDAGMRELWETGWMHNRVRMVAASFLTKNLLLSWTEGARWFWDTLADADLANNTMGWQWTAGCGADAAPFFRIFNPTRQAERFDPNGEYLRRWVPELARLPNHLLREPWSADTDELAKAGVVLGKTYPRLIADFSATRQRALKAYQTMRDDYDKRG